VRRVNPRVIYKHPAAKDPKEYAAAEERARIRKILAEAKAVGKSLHDVAAPWGHIHGHPHKLKAICCKFMPGTQLGALHRSP
jgi:hypothetical protein